MTYIKPTQTIIRYMSLVVVLPDGRLLSISNAAQSGVRNCTITFERHIPAGTPPLEYVTHYVDEEFGKGTAQVAALFQSGPVISESHYCKSIFYPYIFHITKITRLKVKNTKLVIPMELSEIAEELKYYSHPDRSKFSYITHKVISELDKRGSLK